MDQHDFDTWTRRRFAAVGGFSALIGLGLVERGAAKKKKKSQSRCRPDGTHCGKEGKQCQAKFCLHAPFTVEASGTSEFDHDAYLFVPAQNAATGPSPYLNFSCNDANSHCATQYPFACIDGGVTTVHKLLAGTYEYWLQLHEGTLAGEVSVVLRDKGGRVVQQFESPANSADQERGWHVFDVDGKRGSVIAIDELADKNLPRAAHDPITFVCAF
jgi:hypothetical protein